MQRILAASFAGLFLALAASAAAHPGGDGFSNVYLVSQHSRDAVVVETNNLLTNGLQVYGSGNLANTDSGAQLHHACVVPGWTSGRGGSYDAIYAGDVFYNYIIAQDNVVQFDDAGQVANALAYWLGQNSPAVPLDPDGNPIWDDYDFEAACGAAGGAFHHPDLFAVLDDNAATEALYGATGIHAYSIANPFPPTRRVAQYLCGTPPVTSPVPPPVTPPALPPLPANPLCPLPAPIPAGNPLPVVPIPELPHL